MHIVMLLAKKLLHTRYRVNDLEKTVEFYKNVLGLEEVRRHKSPRGSELAFLKAPESEETVRPRYIEYIRNEVSAPALRLPSSTSEPP